MASGFLGGQSFVGRVVPLPRGRGENRNARPLGSPGFRAGAGFALQPLGFNISLGEFQDPDLFGPNVGRRRSSAGAVGRSLATRSRLPGRPGIGGATLLTGNVPRSRLTPGGTVRGRQEIVIAPDQTIDQSGFERAQRDFRRAEIRARRNGAPAPIFQVGGG